MSSILSALCIGARESEWAPLPSQGAAFYGGSKEFQRANVWERFEILRGTVNRRREAKQRPCSAQGAEKPRSSARYRGQEGQAGRIEVESEISGTEDGEE